MLGKEIVRSGIAIPLVMMDKMVQAGLSRHPLIHPCFPPSRYFSGALGGGGLISNYSQAIRCNAHFTLDAGTHQP